MVTVRTYKQTNSPKLVTREKREVYGALDIARVNDPVRRPFL